MELSQLFATIRRNWWASALALLACLAVAFSAASAPSRYRATAQLSVRPPGDVTYDVLQATQFLMPEIIAEAESSTMRQGVARRLPAMAAVDYDLRVINAPGTPLMSVNVESRERQAVATIANDVAAALPAVPNADQLVFRTIEPASPPSAPFAPQRGILMLAGLVIGLIAAVFAALLANVFRPRLGSASLRDTYGLRVLGEVPPAGRGGVSPAVVFDGGDRRTLEAYEEARAQLQVAVEARDAKAVAIAPVGRDELAPAVVANLSWALASTGRGVVLVDTNLRDPSLHELFGTPLNGGLAEVARGGRIRTEATELSTLVFLPAGVPDQLPTAVVSLALPRVLPALESPDWLMVFSCPPASSAETALVMARTKAVVLLVDQRRDRPEDLQHAVAQARESGATVLGVVTVGSGGSGRSTGVGTGPRPLQRASGRRDGSRRGSSSAFGENAERSA